MILTVWIIMVALWLGLGAIVAWDWWERRGGRPR